MEVILNWDETWGWGIIKDTIINPGKKKKQNRVWIKMGWYKYDGKLER